VKSLVVVLRAVHNVGAKEPEELSVLNMYVKCVPLDVHVEHYWA
jgi:hypothetical protein